MKTLILLWLSIQPVDHLSNPKRPLWANQQDVYTTCGGISYEYLRWPAEHELWIHYWRKPILKVKTFKWKPKD